MLGINRTEKPAERFTKIRKWNKEGGVLLVGYEMLRTIVEKKGVSGLDKQQHSLMEGWLLEGPNLVVADEAHTLRNSNSHIHKIASSFRTARRIALTGSPLPNSLQEYYWMVNWIAPQFFEDFETFKRKFLQPIEAASDSNSDSCQRKLGQKALEVLSGILKPKIDRADFSVLKDELPPKFEFHVTVTLSPIQKEFYNLFVRAVRDGTAEGLTAQLMSWLGVLQLCCNHPRIFYEKLKEREHKAISAQPVSEGTNAQSLLRKIDELLGRVADTSAPELSHRVMILNAIITESIKHGDKVLVFSQSVPTLHYLEDLFQNRNLSFCTLTGETTAAFRQGVVEKFNSTGAEAVLLISTRAGGVGINLQSANRVVIFDFSFNPIWEEQAVGRAYRMGQKKPVYIYRLVSGGTFEDHLAKRVRFKSELAIRVVDHVNITRMGSKTSSTPLLADHVDPGAEPQISREACVSDPGVMGTLVPPRHARMIAQTSILRQQNEGEELTLEERRSVRDSVEDEISMRLLRISDPLAYATEIRRRSSLGAFAPRGR